MCVAAEGRVELGSTVGIVLDYDDEGEVVMWFSGDGSGVVLKDGDGVARFMKPFGCHVTILNTLDNLGKFDGKSDEGIQRMILCLVNLSTRSRYQDCIVLPICGRDASDFGDAAPRSVADVNTDRNGLHVINTGSREVSTALPEVNTATPEDLVGPSPASEDTQVEDQEIELGNIPQSYVVPTTPHTRIHKDHPIDHVIGDVQSSVQTRRMTTSYSELGFLSAIYEGKYNPIFLSLGAIVYKVGIQKENKKDERRIVMKQSKTLVAKGHMKKRAYDYDEGSESTIWTPSSTKSLGHILLVQIYVDDIIFGSTKKELCDEFEKLMKDKFQMSSMGELTFFLGLQVQQKKKGIFISQDKYVNEILRKFNYTYVKSASTPTDLEKPLVQDGDAADVDEHLYRSMIGSLMYLTASRPDIMFADFGILRIRPLEIVAYTNSDYAGATQDRKSTTRGCQFLGNRLISWQCKKQIVVATSTTKAKYVAAANCCGQGLLVVLKVLVVTPHNKFVIRSPMSYRLKEIVEFRATATWDALPSPKQTAIGKDNTNTLMAG
ncbi:putative ribonuclease H-like domain-containing protein [Tanacetum coccineum]